MGIEFKQCEEALLRRYSARTRSIAPNPDSGSCERCRSLRASMTEIAGDQKITIGFCDRCSFIKHRVGGNNRIKITVKYERPIDGSEHKPINSIEIEGKMNRNIWLTILDRPRSHNSLIILYRKLDPPRTRLARGEIYYQFEEEDDTFEPETLDELLNFIDANF